jgi:hypothetical protein
VAAPCSIVFHDTAAVRPGSNDAGELEMSPMWRERLVVAMRPGFRAFTAIPSGAQRFAASTVNSTLAVFD